MPDLSETLAANLVPLWLGAGTLLLLALGWSLQLSRRVGRLNARLDALTRGATGEPLEAVLQAHLQRVQAVADGLEALAGRTTELEIRGRRAIQRAGLVRFNPFEDTGSNQSFALALLDAHEDGVVISSLHARQSTRLYAKPITAGQSEMALSAEEAEALRAVRAPRSGGSARP